MSKAIRLVVGLGNPGSEYAGSRHNIGFDFLDAVAAHEGVRLRDEARFFGQVAKLASAEGELWLLKPTTYMNLSGTAVQALCAYFKIAPDETLIVHDELDLVPGTMRLKIGGGNAGHNGLKSITEQLSTPNFWRLRIGIGHPRIYCPQMQVHDWVLARPQADHREGIDTCIEAARKALPHLVLGQFDRAERSLAKYVHPPKPEEETQ